MKTALIATALSLAASQVSAATVDSFTINMNGNSVDYDGVTGAFSNVTLDAGVEYVVTVSGTFLISCQGQDTCPTDAEYYVAVVPNEPFNYTGLSNTPGVGIDIGVALDDVKIDWGAFNPSRVYSTIYTGTGSALKATFIDTNHPDNRGSLTVEISTRMNAVVPLPATIPLLLAGLGSLALIRRRR